MKKEEKKNAEQTFVRVCPLKRRF